LDGPTPVGGGVTGQVLEQGHNLIILFCRGSEGREEPGSTGEKSREVRGTRTRKCGWRQRRRSSGGAASTSGLFPIGTSWLSSTFTSSSLAPLVLDGSSPPVLLTPPYLPHRHQYRVTHRPR